MTPYENYCNIMKERGMKPTMNEAQVHEAWGIKREEEHTPFLSLRSSIHKNIKPTLSVHIDLAKKPKEEIKPHAKNEELLKKLESRIKKPRELRKKEVVPRAPRPNSLAHLSPDEKRAYHSKKRLELYHKSKVLKPKIPLTEEQKKERKSEYSKSYIQKMKEIGKVRKKLTDEQKEAQKLWKINNRRKRGILPRTKMSEEEKQKSIKEQSKRWRDKLKAEGKKRVLTPEQ